jgi:large subunit ribosomal protein L13
MSKNKNNRKTIKRQWHLFDASKESFGRLASKAAVLLRGKNKLNFAPNVDGGDYVVVINSDNLKYTGRKGKNKIYYRYSGYIGGIKSISLDDQIKKDSREVIRKAVYRMLSKNRLRDQMIKRLKVYKNSDHPYENKFDK